MNPMLLFPLALIVPVIVAIVAFVPAYAGFFGAVYFIYDQPDVANPLLPYKFDIFYILDVYSQLFSHWSENTGDSGFMEFTLPLLGFPALGLGIALYLTYKLVSGLVNFFRMSTVN